MDYGTVCHPQLAMKYNIRRFRYRGIDVSKVHLITYSNASESEAWQHMLKLHDAQAYFGRV
jgi:hypothetical protein